MIYVHVVPAKNSKNAVTIISGHVLPIVTEMHNVSFAYVRSKPFKLLLKRCAKTSIYRIDASPVCAIYSHLKYDEYVSFVS
ncbi:hypothetical protein BML2537_22420 [Providencia stuartii]|nr:hypothetical protein DR96_3280 [Providencia stuartii]SST01035.1 Uncharacterised protein [Acinetobacter baumannii]GHB86445.1 hypothetical protein GCM10007290_09610 [Providencia thailandensis]CAK6612127.1 Y1-Tnp domain-containing protein [Providencia stuartii]CAK6613463.1 Y1-Tnp domain-containing protein [Providencia stuartii]